MNEKQNKKVVKIANDLLKIALDDKINSDLDIVEIFKELFKTEQFLFAHETDEEGKKIHYIYAKGGKLIMISEETYIKIMSWKK